MDALPMIMLTVPIFLPIVLKLGFDPIWFGVMIIFVMQLGLITPPVGMNCYVISGIARDVPLQTIFRGSAPFIIPLLLAIAICTAFPILATWLPTVFYG
jgi:TRAP-type C4-dicarboxylate transport system permease large subunit